MKKLSELCRRIRIKDTNVCEDYYIEGISVDSAKVKENYIFVETEGNSAYTPEALKKGAVIVISQNMHDEIPCIKVENIRESMSLICSEFYDNPQSKLKIIGVVGTNGKTSVTHILANIFRKVSKIAIIGTLGIWINDKKYDNNMTSPDSPELFYYLAECVKNKVEYVFCEITAHAIYFEKFYGIRTEMCVFTNISRDHLDFFETFEKYADTKVKYFCRENMKFAVVNSDDKYGIEIINKSKLCSVSYGIIHPSDVFAIDISQKNGLSFIINAFDDILYIKTKLIGKFNVYNILAAIAVAKSFGLKNEIILNAINELEPIEGRLNIVNKKPLVVVDFAHSPDGLKNVLETLKDVVDGKIISVFGCGGNRDKGKRPIMGMIGTTLSDVCIFTSDNPRFEDPGEIISDIVSGVGDAENFRIVEDRREAINLAIKIASPEDCVIICGKGGENYIDVKGKKIPFNDKDICKKILETVK